MNVSNQNPWWNGGGLWEDKDLNRVKNSRLHYRPKTILLKDLIPDAVLTLRGPRRSGKTVTLKLLLAELIEKRGIDPRSILWISLETTRTLEKMEAILSEWIERLSPKFLFIDEVTSITDWQKVVKKLVDIGILAGVCTVLTGSSAHDLKKGSERMAGRKGNIDNPDRILLPMSYSEFLHQIPFPDRQNVATYLEIGGFPFRIEDFIQSNGKLQPHEKLSVLDDVYFYEINRRKLDRNIALDILGRLAEVKNHSLSYESFVKPLSIAKDTAKKYLNALGDAFLLATFYSFDTGRNRVSLKKDKKFVWVDSSLSFLAKSMEQGEASDEACRAEWVLGIELLRRYEIRLWEGISAPRNVFTWKSSGGNEIDYLVVNRATKTKVPFEMKYQDSITDWDFQIMEQAFHKGILVTKRISRNRKESQALSMESFLLS